jgi:hypothetical protein
VNLDPDHTLVFDIWFFILRSSTCDFCCPARCP